MESSLQSKSSDDLFREISNTVFNSTDKENSPPKNVPFITAEALIGILAVLGNGIVITAYLAKPNIRIPRNYYVVNVAIADFLAGLIGVPTGITLTIGWPHHFQSCLFTICLNVSVFNTSIFAVMIIALDRLFAVAMPLVYRRNATPNFVVGMIVSSWVLGIATGSAPIYAHQAQGFHQTNSCFFPLVIDYTYLVFLSFATLALPLTIMIFSYAYIFCIVRKVLYKKQGVGEVVQTRGENSTRDTNVKEIKAAGKLGSIVVAFVLCWLPLQLMNCLAVLRVFTPSLTQIEISVATSHANSALNPILYAFLLVDFRQAMKESLWRPTSYFRNLLFRETTTSGTGTLEECASSPAVITTSTSSV